MDRRRRKIAAGITIGLTRALGLEAQRTVHGPEDGAGGAVYLGRMFQLPACGCAAQAGEWKPDSAGQLMVGISEHVTYWNSLGWSDPFSSPVYTERQNAYSERFHLEGVYTPQMVINGAEQIVGSDRAAFLQAVQEEQRSVRGLSPHSFGERGGDKLTVNFSTSGDLPAHGADLIAVLADDSDRSNVLHGENSGQTLAHVSVARSISRVAKLKTAGEQTVQIPIPSSFQAAQGII